MNFNINPNRISQTPEEKEKEIQNYNIEYYDEFNKIFNIFKKFRNDIEYSETYNEEFGTEGHGLEGLKRLKVNKGPFFGIPRIKTYKNFDEILKDKNNKPQNQAQNKNNSCLIGGRILTLNELDQIIDRIKKHK